MNTDIRISTSFKGHRKRKRLKRLLGPESDSYLIDLWLTVSTDCPNGHMVGWDAVDIADACGWDDDPKKLVDALIECNWIEKDMQGEYSVHDWCIHQAWACKAGERSKIARKAADTRWKNKHKKDAKSNVDECILDAESMPNACGEHAESNAPILSLPILPLPNLSTPEKTGELNFEKIGRDSGADDEIIKMVYNYQQHVSEKNTHAPGPMNYEAITSGSEDVKDLINIDGYTLDEIRKTLLWALNDDFWKDQVLSLKGIRHTSPGGLTKFANISVRMDAEKTPATKPKLKSNAEAVADMLAGQHCLNECGD